ncbi:MAG: hypothetical protein O2782_20605 [bacterium]|nr:hypothetical protein [bacterium]
MRTPAPMTHRERALAVLRYQKYDRLPIVHFGFWSGHTPQKWASEGHISQVLAEAWADGNEADFELGDKLGFDFNWQCMFGGHGGLRPGFDTRVVDTFADGTRHVLNGNGVVVVQRPQAGSIPAEIDHLLKDRASWEQHYRHRLQWTQKRVTEARVVRRGYSARWDQGGLETLRASAWDTPYGLHCGSLFGEVRNLLGLEGSCYLLVDDEALFDEIIDTVADLCYRKTQYILAAGTRFDFAHFWEDISFKNGPLISPRVFHEKVGPHYRRVTELLTRHGIDIVSVDSDGDISALIPTWIENGVNTMFPIEVGTWGANLAPWRQQYGTALRGVGGTNKNAFARDRAAVDAEIERLQPLVDLGGYIPCPDHRLAPDAKWELVQYYTSRLREIYG